MSAAEDLLGQDVAFLNGRVSLGTAAVLIGVHPFDMERLVKAGTIPLAAPEWSRGWRRRVRLSDLAPFATVTPETVAAAEAAFAARARQMNEAASRRRPPHGPPPTDGAVS